MSSSWKSAYRYGNIGLELVLSFFVGLFGGRWIDRHFLGGHGYGTAVGTVVGLYAGARSFYKMAKQLQRETEAEEAREREEAARQAKIDAYKRAVDSDETPAEKEPDADDEPKPG